MTELSEQSPKPISDFMQRFIALQQERERDPVWQAQAAAEREERERWEAGIPDAEMAEWKRRVQSVAGVRCAINAFSEQSTPALEAVKRWLEAKKHAGLVLRGGVGCGKTSAACYAVREWLGRPEVSRYDDRPRKGYSFHGGPSFGQGVVSWLRPDQLVSAVMHGYDPNSPKLARHVVIDDMGRETKSDFAESLCELLDDPEYTVLITTNLNRNQMRERYDLRLLDRLNDSCIAVDLPGKSMRRQDGGF